MWPPPTAMSTASGPVGTAVVDVVVVEVVEVVLVVEVVEVVLVVDVGGVWSWSWSWSWSRTCTTTSIVVSRGVVAAMQIEPRRLSFTVEVFEICCQRLNPMEMSS